MVVVVVAAAAAKMMMIMILLILVVKKKGTVLEAPDSCYHHDKVYVCCFVDDIMVEAEHAVRWSFFPVSSKNPKK